MLTVVKRGEKRILLNALVLQLVTYFFNNELFLIDLPYILIGKSMTNYTEMASYILKGQGGLRTRHWLQI